MSLRLPSRGLAEWAQELVDECYTSRESRRDQITTWKSYYYTGRADGSQARYNRCFSHVDRLASMLFSPVDVRFSISYDTGEDKRVHDLGDAAGRQLNKEFHRCGVDISFSAGVNWALVKGCMLLKTLWGRGGLEPWLVHPECFGVLREDIDDLDRQEAFVQTTYLTKGQFRRIIEDHPDQGELLKEVDHAAAPMRSPDDLQESFFHNIVLGGTAAPVQLTTPQGTGQVNVVNIPTPVLSTQVAQRLIRLHELWVLDRQRQDWTTIRLVEPGIVVEGRDGKKTRRPSLLAEGKYRRRNLSGVPEKHPYLKICPNEVDGYFWGASEIAQIYRLQDLLNDQVADIARLTRLKADPPRAATGFSGITKEKYKVLKRPGGFISEENPNAKIQSLAEDIPPELFAAVGKTVEWYDDVAGFTPILSGMGDTGVRAGNQAQTLTRNASPRLRDRALLVESEVVALGDFCLDLLAAKKADVYDTELKQRFMLSQLPEGYNVHVDSHTASPVFQEDAERKAFMLKKVDAIDNADVIALVHPPHEDRLIQKAKEKAQAQAELLKAHPELLMKGKTKR